MCPMLKAPDVVPECLDPQLSGGCHAVMGMRLRRHHAHSSKSMSSVKRPRANLPRIVIVLLSTLKNLPDLNCRYIMSLTAVVSHSKDL